MLAATTGSWCRPRSVIVVVSVLTLVLTLVMFLMLTNNISTVNSDKYVTYTTFKWSAWHSSSAQDDGETITDDDTNTSSPPPHKSWLSSSDAYVWQPPLRSVSALSPAKNWLCPEFNYLPIQWNDAAVTAGLAFLIRKQVVAIDERTENLADVCSKKKYLIVADHFAGLFSRLSLMGWLQAHAAIATDRIVIVYETFVNELFEYHNSSMSDERLLRNQYHVLLDVSLCQRWLITSGTITNLTQLNGLRNNHNILKVIDKRESVPDYIWLIQHLHELEGMLHQKYNNNTNNVDNIPQFLFATNLLAVQYCSSAYHIQHTTLMSIPLYANGFFGENTQRIRTQYDYIHYTMLPEMLDTSQQSCIKLLNHNKYSIDEYINIPRHCLKIPYINESLSVVRTLFHQFWFHLLQLIVFRPTSPVLNITNILINDTITQHQKKNKNNDNNVLTAEKLFLSRKDDSIRLDQYSLLPTNNKFKKSNVVHHPSLLLNTRRLSSSSLFSLVGIHVRRSDKCGEDNFCRDHHELFRPFSMFTADMISQELKLNTFFHNVLLMTDDYVLDAKFRNWTKVNNHENTNNLIIPSPSPSPSSSSSSYEFLAQLYADLSFACYGRTDTCTSQVVDAIGSSTYHHRHYIDERSLIYSCSAEYIFMHNQANILQNHYCMIAQLYFIFHYSTYMIVSSSSNIGSYFSTVLCAKYQHYPCERIKYIETYG